MKISEFIKTNRAAKLITHLNLRKFKLSLKIDWTTFSDETFVSKICFHIVKFREEPLPKQPNFIYYAI